jgi:hypothetical protein
MMTIIYNNYFFKKWEYLCLNIFTFGKIDDTKLFMRNFSFIIVAGYGTFFFQLVNGYVMNEYPNILKSMFSIGSLFVTCCFFTIIIDYKKSNNILSSKVSATCEKSINKDQELNLKIKFNNEYELKVIIDERINSIHNLKDDLVISIEDKIKDFFLDDKYTDFKEKCILNGLLDENSLEWLSSVANFAVFFHKLKNNNFIKTDNKKYTQKKFAALSNEMFNINSIDGTMISKYVPGNTHYLLGGYHEFYDNALSFIGNK